MKIKLYEMLGRVGNAKGRIPSLQEVAEATGMSRVLLTDIRKNRTKRLRPEHLDALAVYLSEQLGEPITESDLIAFEPIALPLALNLRPDRQGKQVRKPKASSTNPPPPAPPATDARARQRAALVPPTAGAVDAEKQRQIEERRAKLLAQAKQVAGQGVKEEGKQS